MIAPTSTSDLSLPRTIWKASPLTLAPPIEAMSGETRLSTTVFTTVAKAVPITTAPDPARLTSRYRS
jgi:hypothetical protein